jgi:hypothetical protein
MNSEIKAVTAARNRRIRQGPGQFPGPKGEGFPEEETFLGFLVPEEYLGQAVILGIGQYGDEKIGFVLNMKGLPFLYPEVPDPLHGGKVKRMLYTEEVHIIKGAGPGAEYGASLFYGAGPGRGNISLVH